MYGTKLIRHTISYCVEKKDLALLPECIFLQDQSRTTEYLTLQLLTKLFAKRSSKDLLRNFPNLRGQVLTGDAVEGHDQDCV